MIIYHAYKKDEPCFYIGKTIHSLNHRRRQHENESRHLRCNSHFYKAMRKYGIDAFEWRILEQCDTIEELNNAEIKWIALVRECGHRLYNISDGGTGGDMGGSKYWATNGIRDETKEKISNTLKEYFATHSHPMKGKTCVGKPHTEEAKKKISAANIGHNVSEITRQKLREVNLGKKLMPHVIDILRDNFSGANNPSAKSVVCVTTGEVFEYAKLAAIKYSIDLSSIIKCCRGKLKTVRKMKFEYYNQESPTAYPQGWKKL